MLKHLLKTAGFTQVRFIDAMGNHLEDRELAVQIQTYQPSGVLVTAITAMIDKSQSALKLVQFLCSNARAIMGGCIPPIQYPLRPELLGTGAKGLGLKDAPMQQLTEVIEITYRQGTTTIRRSSPCYSPCCRWGNSENLQLNV